MPSSAKLKVAWLREALGKAQSVNDTELEERLKREVNGAVVQHDEFIMQHGYCMADLENDKVEESKFFLPGKTVSCVIDKFCQSSALIIETVLKELKSFILL